MKTIYVYFDDFRVTEPQLMGRLFAQPTRGKEIFSFEFEPQWLQTPYCRLLDPDLQYFKGRQFVSESKTNFGIFTDSAPDRWGRVLLERRESLRAKETDEPRRTLMESDFLLGVYDRTRMGALRLKLEQDGPFLDEDPGYSTPPFTTLGELEQASWHLENDDDPEIRKWLQILLAPGSSLGGARPKANIAAKDNSLWIAKFPSRSDRQDIGAWEAVAMQLAKQCGIVVADFDLARFQHYATFLTRRFDRTLQGRRIHLTSAMTMLGYSDGQTDGCSYLDLAEWLSRNSCHAQEDLQQMWRRLVFNIAVSNCDDHLRNHGFLLTQEGWRLSPAYDLNPMYYGSGLSLNIDEHSNALEYGLAMDVAPYFGVEANKAAQIVADTRSVVGTWRKWASFYHISREEQEQMAPAFRTA
ncbi:MAG: HipA domain-containing protein [Paludibacteraceae bacterium]|nr:HipA domain-containing protein [Paludibacteraceae bacterium]